MGSWQAALLTICLHQHCPHTQQHTSSRCWALLCAELCTTDSCPTAALFLHTLAALFFDRVPGAKTVSYANAGLFGGCGMVAALVAWLAGLSLLVVLLGR
jgi:hypothetical protein